MLVLQNFQIRTKYLFDSVLIGCYFWVQVQIYFQNILMTVRRGEDTIHYTVIILKNKKKTEKNIEKWKDLKISYSQKLWGK
jgi:hypothetical protein